MKATKKANIERRTLVQMLRVHGADITYNGAPTMSYTINKHLTLDRDGNITGEPRYLELNRILLTCLEANGYIDIEEDEQEAATEAAENWDDEDWDDGEEDRIEAEADAQMDDNGAEESYEEFLARREQPETAIGFDIEGWGAEKLRNLVFTIFSKGNLISKATGGEFGARCEWCEAHKKDNNLTWIDIDNALKDELIWGIGFNGTGKRVYFSGLKPTTEMEPDELERNLLLFGSIIKAIGSDAKQRVQIKMDASENEKYAFRSWITRLGWTDKSEASKKARAAFYAKLNGHVAFRTPADEAKWKEKQAAKRAAAKAAKEGGTADGNA